MPFKKTTMLLMSLFAVIILLIGASVFFLVRAGTEVSSVARPKQDKVWSWRLMMIGRRIDSPFWKEVYGGAKALGDDTGAVVELCGPSSDADRKSLETWLDYAIASRPDGIIAYVNDTAETRDLISRASRKGIPIITLERDVANVPRQSFVGVSSYELGGLLGGLVYDAVGPSGNAIVVLDGVSRGAAENAMLSSLQEKIQQYPSLRVSPFDIGGGASSSYDERIRRRILEDRNLDAIVCLNVEDTIRVAQTVVELNRTGRVSIIAFRESKEIFDYVRKGIVRAVVVVDARQMGSKAVEAMMEYLSTGHANDYVITEMHVVTRDTVDTVDSAESE